MADAGWRGASGSGRDCGGRLGEMGLARADRRDTEARQVRRGGRVLACIDKYMESEGNRYGG